MLLVKNKKIYFLCILFSFFRISFASVVDLGVDVFFQEEHIKKLKGKKIALLTNHTGINSQLVPTRQLFQNKKNGIHLSAIFSPEHGINGSCYAGEKVGNKEAKIPVFSLHGKNKRPTDEMLKNIDVIIFDMQEIGCRSYTYASTLYYIIEAAAKKKISVIILDRPNPMGGEMVDGPMLDKKWRSFVGYINVPYCHGMTIGELARYFNEEYHIGCNLCVISMKGWKRNMSYEDTGLSWVPTSPHIPEANTPLFCASTGIIGELGWVSVGIGYTLPFKIVGAPWIDADTFAFHLNKQKLLGVYFMPFSFRPFYGIYKGKDCYGVKIIVTDKTSYRPMAVQYLLLGILKSLYPKEIARRLENMTNQKKKMFCQVNGNSEILDCLLKEKYIAWKLIQFQEEERNLFLEKRKKYLLY